jgi:hypothetical protein
MTTSSVDYGHRELRGELILSPNSSKAPALSQPATSTSSNHPALSP